MLLAELPYSVEKKGKTGAMADFSADAIRAQLARITASPEFANGAKLAQFLSFVVEQTLQGNKKRLKQYTIAVEGLAYGPGFDPMSNPTVRITAGRLRRALDRYYAGAGTADPIRIAIPKGGYAPVFSGRQATSSDRETSELESVVAARPSRETGVPTIAVFEFEDRSDPSDDSIVAVGLTAEIIVALTQFSDLSVVGPLNRENAGVSGFRNVLDDFGAAFALQGWLRTHGSTVRITIDLSDSATGVSMWGRTFKYDLDTTSLFEIEDAVTSQLVGAIADGLGVIFRSLQSESYREHIKFNDITSAVLGYNYAWQTHSPQAWSDANQDVDTALASHPDNALLLALQANIYYADALHELNLVPDAGLKMEPLANRAVASDPRLQLAQYNLVVLHAFFGRAEECVDAARKVVAMNPHHARVLAGCAVATASVGAYAVAKELIERAKRLNPHYPGWYFFIDFLSAFHDQRYEEAWRCAQRIQTPGLLWQPLFRAAALGKLARSDEAKPFVEELLRIKPDFAGRSRDYIRRLCITDEHVEMLCDGLAKAGIDDGLQLSAVAS